MNISAAQKDALTELINIGTGHAASTLNMLINHNIRLNVPRIEIKSRQSIENDPDLNQGSTSSVSMNFNGQFNGNASLIFPKESAHSLVSLLTGENTDSAEIDDLRSGTLSEVGNILLNGVMGSLSNMLATTLDYSVPTYQEGGLHKVIGNNKSEAVLIAHAIFHIDELCIVGNILLFFEIESLQSLLHAIDKELMA